MSGLQQSPMELHILLAGVEFGPYTDDQARELLGEGFLSATDPAKRLDETDWLPLNEVLAQPREATTTTQPEPVTETPAAEEESAAATTSASEEESVEEPPVFEWPSPETPEENFAAKAATPPVAEEPEPSSIDAEPVAELACALPSSPEFFPNSASPEEPTPASQPPRRIAQNFRTYQALGQFARAPRINGGGEDIVPAAPDKCPSRGADWIRAFGNSAPSRHASPIGAGCDEGSADNSLRLGTAHFYLGGLSHLAHSYHRTADPIRHDQGEEGAHGRAAGPGVAARGAGTTRHPGAHGHLTLEPIAARPPAHAARQVPHTFASRESPAKGTSDRAAPGGNGLACSCEKNPGRPARARGNAALPARNRPRGTRAFARRLCRLHRALTRRPRFLLPTPPRRSARRSG